MANHQLVNQDSGNQEWITPPEIIAAVKECSGFIELDPATSLAGQQIIGAERCFTKEHSGLDKSWEARVVWLNHPFGRGSNEVWISKLISEYTWGHLRSSYNICFAATSELWFRPLLKFPQCFLHGRTNYLDPVTLKPVKGVTKGSVVTYLGPNIERFASVFSRLGTVKMAYGGAK